MSISDYVHLAIAKEAQEALRREPHEAVQAFDRRLDKYIHRRLQEVAETILVLDRERAVQRLASSPSGK